jgi:hypothetical protein
MASLSSVSDEESEVKPDIWLLLAAVCVVKAGVEFLCYSWLVLVIQAEDAAPCLFFIMLQYPS